MTNVVTPPGDGPLAALQRALDLLVAPLLARDGAGVEIHRLEDGVLELRASGSLRGCPGRTWTARGVILPVARTVDASIHDVRII
ncbi:MAG: NifU family protein [Polyangiales bacterium]